MTEKSLNPAIEAALIQAAATLAVEAHRLDVTLQGIEAADRRSHGAQRPGAADAITNMYRQEALLKRHSDILQVLRREHQITP